MSLAATFAELVAMASRGESIYASYGGLDYRLFNKLLEIGTTTTTAALLSFLDEADDDTFPWAARLLVFKDPDLALERRLHLDPRSRVAFTDLEWRIPVPTLARWFTQLLESDDPASTRLALACYPPKQLGLGTRLDPPLSNRDAAYRLVTSSPDFIPVDLVRARLDDADPELRRGAAQLLSWLHHPEDAERVIAATTEVGPFAMQWLAAVPSAARFAPWLVDDEYAELLRRRRCAGLSNAELPRRELDLRSAYAGSIVLELRDPELAERWIQQASVSTDRAPLVHAVLATLGKRGLALLDTWKHYPWEPYGKFVRAYRQAYKQHPQPPHEAFFPVEAITHADTHFRDGALDGAGSAFALYAHVLYWIPDHAYAAYQLAWIDRAYGTPITPARISWLHALGTPQPLLDELAIPITPLPAQILYRHVPRQDMQTGTAERETHLDRARSAFRR